MDKPWGIEDLANFLGVPKNTIYQWRSKGYGPPSRKVGRYVKYLPDEVRRWLHSLPKEVG
ncbi:helix-turn-helix transcriptional regulator [Longimycelium tulufanense]|nr:helix-turn-helix domain-containing protein [Longimycelium tulufanense]